MDVMVDLETLGTGSDCVVISLGACVFSAETGQVGGTFYMALEVQDQLDKGRVIDADTLKWWMGQANAAKKVFHEKATSPTIVLNLFSKWLQDNVPNFKERMLWGNGATFDISIMESMYKCYNIKQPWSYLSVMDLRTFRRFIGKGAKVEKLGTNHNALDDALSQAKYVIYHNRPVNKPAEIYYGDPVVGSGGTGGNQQGS